jgi:DNA-binding HxlR family transcriptional regulator
MARALDVVGERWTLLIVRDLLLAPRRYTDLLDGLPGITTNLLAKRLKEMSAAGLIDREALPSPVRAEVYSLTDRGRALEPVLMALGAWGRPLMDRVRRDDVLNLGSALLSLKNMYRGGVQLEVELHADGRTFELTFLPSELRVLERPAARPDVVVRSSIVGLRRLFFGGEPLASLVREGAVAVEGDLRKFGAVVEATARR